MVCFADINVSRGSIATCARRNGILNIHLTTNLPRNLQWKKLNRLRFDRIRVMSLWPTVLVHPVDCVVWLAVCSVWDSGVRQAAKACMLKLANHRRWFDTIVIYVLHTFQFYLNDSVRASVMSAVNDGMNLTTANLDCVILNSLKKQVNCLSLPTISSSSSPKKSSSSPAVTYRVCHKSWSTLERHIFRNSLSEKAQSNYMIIDCTYSIVNW